MQILGSDKPLVGVVHLLPLPGSPGYGGSMRPVIDRAVADASAYLTGGIGALIVENYGDLPFLAGLLPPETIAALAVIAHEVRALTGQSASQLVGSAANRSTPLPSGSRNVA